MPERPRPCHARAAQSACPRQPIKPTQGKLGDARPVTRGRRAFELGAELFAIVGQGWDRHSSEFEWLIRWSRACAMAGMQLLSTGLLPGFP
jgi:hypothetical protein